VRLAAGALVAVAVAVLAVANRATIGSGGASLAGADLGWLAVALALTTVLWVAGTAAQLGAVPIRPPLTQLFAVQVAASIVNQVVPGGIGGMAINVRYLQRSGMTRPAAVAAVGMNSLATLITHLALIAAVWSLAPAVLPGGALDSLVAPAAGGLGAAALRLLPGSSRLVEGAIGVVVVVAVVTSVAAWLVGAERRRSAFRWLRSAPSRGRGHVSRELRATAHVLIHPGRAALLWLGSAASPALHAFVLVAVYNSLAGGISGLVVAFVYLVASAVAALVPSPGGFGALDVTLVAGLVAVGAPTTTAVAAVLGYRLITVWVPLVPGALVFAVLLRRHVL
jgi:uncharacterized membrane protein YbhN (UPF0104 family)